MKTIYKLVLILIILISHQVEAQDALKILQNGNVGIGTEPQNDKLIVGGNIHIDAPASNDQIDAMTIDVKGFNNITNAQRSTFFKVKDIAGYSQPFTIRGDGNVGIGKLPQSDRLIVGGNIHVDIAVTPNPVDALLVDVAGFSTSENAKKSAFFKIRDLDKKSEPFTVLGDGTITTEAAASTSPINGMTVNVKSFSTRENAIKSTYFKVRDIGGNFQPFMIRGDGNVGIGTEDPSQAKLVVFGSVSTELAYSYLTKKANVAITGQYAGISPCSIYASDRVAATEFNAFSDERIKNIIGVSNNENDLKILSKIEITNYKMIDTIAKGNQLYKKVIAQQVEKVYPAAVNKHLTDVIPNIYQLSAINNGWIDITVKDLIAGDKVKLVFSKEQIIVDVLEIGKGKIKVNCEKEGDVFVYGKQVNDFRTVDYEAIAMLNISATQALLNRIEVLEAKDTASVNTINELKESQLQLNKRMQKIEERLLHDLVQN
jgi:hypothetical protein